MPPGPPGGLARAGDAATAICGVNAPVRRRESRQGGYIRRAAVYTRAAGEGAGDPRLAPSAPARRAAMPAACRAGPARGPAANLPVPAREGRGRLPAPGPPVLTGCSAPSSSAPPPSPPQAAMSAARSVPQRVPRNRRPRPAFRPGAGPRAIGRRRPGQGAAVAMGMG